MRKILLHPGYFGPVDQFVPLMKANAVLWEREDNYQKQTYRTRQYIYGANGKLLLNIPVLHTHKGEGRQPYKEVKIENQFDWQKTHWKSLESAYRSSPFFEFYEDDLHPLYEKPFSYLIDFNRSCMRAVIDCLQIDLPQENTQEYHKSYADNKEISDSRFLTKAKRARAIEIAKYDQVFQEKEGFIPNLSILDLLFNEGPQASSYLEELAKKTI